MSKTIDERVVSMEFDNSRFEKNVKTTMSTLDKLKQKLNLSGASKGLENVSDAARRCDISPLSRGVETVKARFSAMEVMAVTALANITNSAVNAGKQLAKSLTVDQITSGWNKYEQKTSSVQTIMNSTGKSIDEVNEYLNKLMWFSDETSYGFTDMTAALAQMTSSGGNIDNLIPLITGVANATAYAGKGATEFSRAMYNLNQSYGAGYLQYMDWKSLELAGVAGKDLKQVFIDTAVAMGKIEEGQVTLGNFSETLKDRWADTEVMEAAFGKFSELSEEAYKLVESGQYDTASEAIEALSGKYGDLAEKAFKSAQEAKSFTEAIDATKDAVSSGWLKTFEIIFGNYEEAKVLWTDLANALWETFASGADARNEILQEWKDLGGRDALIESFWNAWEGIASIIAPIKDAFRDIFPPTTAQQLLKITEAIKDFTSKIKISETTSEKLKSTFRGLFSVIDIGWTFIKELAGGIVKLLGNFKGLGGSILDTTASLGDWLFNLRNSIKETNVFGKAIDGVVGFISKAISKIKEFGNAIGDWAGKLKKTIQDSDLWGQRIEKITNILNKAKDAIKDFFSKFGGKIAAPGFDILLTVLGGIWKLIQKIGSVASKFAKTISTAFIDMFRNGDFSTGLDILNGGILTIILLGVKKFVSKIKDTFDGVGGVLDGVKGVLDGVKGCLEAWQQDLKANILLKIAVAIAILTGALVGLSLIDQEKLNSSLKGITVLFIDLMGSMAVFDKYIGQGKGALKGATLMIALSISILILAGALKILSGLNWDELAKGIVGVTVLMGVIVGAMVAFSKLMSTSEKSFSISKKGIFSSSTKNNFLTTGLSLIAIAGAMKVFASAVSDFSELSWEQLAKGVSAVGVILLELTGFMALVKKIKPEKMFSTSIALILIASSLKIFASAVEDFASFDWNQLAKGGAAIAGILLAVALFSKILGNSGSVFSASKNGIFSSKTSKNLISTSIALILIASSLKIFASAVEDFASFDWNQLAKGGAAIAGILLAVGGFVRLLPNSSSMIKTGIGLVVIASSMKIFASAVSDFSELSWEQLAKAGAAIGGILLVIAALSKIVGGSSSIFSRTKDGIFSSSTKTQILKLSAALLIISVSLKIFASAMTEVSKISWEGIAKGLVSIVVIFGILAIAGYALQPVIGIILAFSAAVLFFGLGCLSAGIGIMALSAGLMALSTITAASATAIVAALTIIIVGVLELIPTIIEELTDAIVAICQVIIQGAPAIGEAIKALILTTVDVLVECIPVVVDGLLRLIVGVLEALVEYAPQITDGLIDLFIRILNATTERLPELVDAIINFSIVLLNSVASRITELIAPAVTLVGAIFQGIADAIGPIIENIVCPILEILKSLIVGVVEAIAPHMSTLCDCFTTVTQVISDAIVKIVEAIAPYIPEITSMIETIANAFVSIIEQISPIIDSITSLIQQLGDSITDILGGAADVVKGFGDAVKTSLDGVATVFDSAFGGVADVINSVGDTIKKFLDGISKVIDSVGEAALNAGTGFERLADGVKTITNLKLVDMAASLAAVAKGVRDISSHSKSLAKAGDGMQKITDGIKVHYTSFYNSGKYLGEGLVNGISAKKRAVYDAAFALGQKAVQGEKDGQQSNSPSKLTTKAGKWLGEGLIVGMKNMMKAVYKSGGDLGETASNSISSAVSKVYDLMNSDFDAQPTIRPVLDLSDVSAGASAINSMFGLRPSVGVLSNVGAISSMMNNGQNGTNADVISAIKDLGKNFDSSSGNTYQINGISYSEDSDVSDAIKTLVKAAKIERRT